MKQAVNSDLFLYVDDSCLVYQQNNVGKIEQNLNKNFSNICHWFVENNLSIHFGKKDKMHTIWHKTKTK